MGRRWPRRSRLPRRRLPRPTTRSANRSAVSAGRAPKSALMLTENTQPAILTASIAAFRVLESEGLDVRRAFVAGHSLGEYSAHVAAGTFSFRRCGRASCGVAGRYMQEAVPVGTGAMAAILGLDADKVAQACEEAAQGEVVVAGEPERRRARSSSPAAQRRG